LTPQDFEPKTGIHFSAILLNVTPCRGEFGLFSAAPGKDWQ